VAGGGHTQWRQPRHADRYLSNKLDRKLSIKLSVDVTDLTTLALLLGRLSRLNEAAVTEVCADHGITPAETRVMSLLVHRPDRSASPSDIADFVVQTSGGLTATLRRLEADGLVERMADPSDGRGRLVVLTDAGELVHARVIDAIVARVARVVDGLDLADVDDQVRRLVDAFERDGGLPSSAGFRADVPVSSTGR
jgi:DNA-binding MarR family transcriptional regulator